MYGLAALFAVDAFGGGFIVNAMLALWLFERFGLSVAAAGTIFFATGVCAGLLKIAYDLALLRQCRAVRPPEEEAMPEYRA